MGEHINQALDMETLDHEMLRTAAREALSEEGHTKAAFARTAGFAVSTFSAWLAGKYTGDNDHVTRKVKTYLSTREQQKKTLTSLPRRTDFVMTKSAQSYHRLFEQAQFAPDMVTLVGQPGVGKTEAAREYQRRNSNVFLVTGSPMLRSPWALMQALCSVMGIRERAAMRRPTSISSLLRGRAALIIVDEAQHVSMHALDQLRALHDDPEVACGLALVGHPDLKSRMSGGGRDGAFTQLDSRFGMHLNRRTPLAADVDALLDAEQIDGEAERKLLRTVAAGAGGLRRMNRTLRIARMIALGQGVDAVTAEHVQMAFEQLNPDGVQL